MTKTAFDLSDYTLAELRGLLFDVDRELRERRTRDKDAARARILDIAGKSGLTVDELLGAGKDSAPKGKA